MTSLLSSFSISTTKAEVLIKEIPRFLAIQLLLNSITRTIFRRKTANKASTIRKLTSTSFTRHTIHSSHAAILSFSTMTSKRPQEGANKPTQKTEDKAEEEEVHYSQRPPYALEKGPEKREPKYFGSCHCGDVRFQIFADPKDAQFCQYAAHFSILVC